MNTTVEFSVNGKAHRVTTDAERVLLDVLREDLGLTGTKYGCGEGQCRACTVLVDGQPTTACLMPVSAVAGRKIETIESLAENGRLHPVQEAFVQEGAMQCGYCVPGMIMATVGLLRRKAQPSREDVVDALNGNICRCCGYKNIIAAVERVIKPMKEAK